MTQTGRQGLAVARLLMVMSSISPLFVIWALRGSPLIGDRWFVTACAALVVFPNAFLVLRVWKAQRLNERMTLRVGKHEDHRDHLLVYLFAMLMPFYTSNLSTWREFSAGVVALVVIVFLFFHLNMHYMNIVFAVMGYRVYTLFPPDGDNAMSGRNVIVLISWRQDLMEGESVSAYRVSNTVFFESRE